MTPNPYSARMLATKSHSAPFDGAQRKSSVVLTEVPQVAGVTLAQVCAGCGAAEFVGCGGRAVGGSGHLSHR